jgi:hypothetical protein
MGGVQFTELLTLTSLVILLLSYHILIIVYIFKLKQIILPAHGSILCLICLLKLLHYLLLLLYLIFLFDLIFIHILFLHFPFIPTAYNIKWRCDNLLGWLLLFDEIDSAVISPWVNYSLPLSFIENQIVACCDVIVPICIQLHYHLVSLEPLIFQLL